MPLNNTEKIIADPLSWLHPSWYQLPECFGTGISRGIINKIVVQQFALNNVMPTPEEHCPWSVIIDNWYVLPEAVWYMACQRYRQQLLQHDAELSFSEKSRRFMMMDIVPAVTIADKIDAHRVWQLAWKELSPLFPIIPEEVVKHLRLLFPQHIHTSAGVISNNFDSFLLQMAIQHARKHTATF